MNYLTFHLNKKISSLVNFKDNVKLLSCSEKTLNALLRVGEAVNLAVERFVDIGETLANENLEIQNDMLIACQEARQAGLSIKLLTEMSMMGSTIDLSDYNSDSVKESKQSSLTMTHAANSLLNAIIKVLLLADVVIINQIIKAQKKVSQTLNKLESLSSGFWLFVKLFTQYGSDMIELAHLTGDRQNVFNNNKKS